MRDDRAISLNGVGSVVVHLGNMPQEREINLRDDEADTLAGYITEQFEKYRRHKKDVTEKMIQSLRQRMGEYDPKTLANIRQTVGGSEVYMPITGVKCLALENWVKDILNFGTDLSRLWDILPTPDPDLPEEERQNIIRAVMESAMEIAVATGQDISYWQIRDIARRIREIRDHELMKKARREIERLKVKIKDMLSESNFDSAFDDFLWDLATYKKAIIKGPIYTVEEDFKWVNGQPVLTTQKKMRFERVSPFDIYPSPNSVDFQEGNLIELLRLYPDELLKLRNQPGYDAKAINAAYEEFGQDGYSYSQGDASETERKRLEKKARPSGEWRGDGTIEVLLFWGYAPKRLLPDNVVPSPGDAKGEEIEAMILGNRVLRCVARRKAALPRPYYGVSFERVGGSFWGISLPEKMKPVADACNALMRSLLNNAALSSGPQAVMRTFGLMYGNEKTESIYPMKIWPVPPSARGDRPVEFWQPASTVNSLIRAYSAIEMMADDYTGIPRYQYGSPTVGGAGRTASGLAMLMTNAAKGVRNVLAAIDRDVIRPIIRALFRIILMENSIDYVGDIKIVAKGALAYIHRVDLQRKRMDFLAASANPVDSAIIGPDKRAVVWKELSKDLDLPEDVVPDPQEVAAAMAEAAGVAPPAQGMQTPQQVSGITPGNVPEPRVTEENIQGELQ